MVLATVVKQVKDAHSSKRHSAPITAVPAIGWPAAEVERKFLELRDEDKQGVCGFGERQWVGIYDSADEDPEQAELQEEAQKPFWRSDTLYPGTFTAINKFQAEVIAMAVNLLGGSCGLPSSGGTESNFLAILSYREWGRERGIKKPEVICCSTAHASVEKACHYLGIDLVIIESDFEQKLAASDVRRAITSSTVAVFAAAPCCIYGTVDPIEELAAVCRERNVGLHVDNCLGGIHLSCLTRLGLFRRGFDFRVEGVTSMSIDLHKYGQGMKGASVVAFSDPAARLRVLVPACGHTVTVTPALEGSRSGATWAAAWAMMLHIGRAGYERHSREYLAVQEYVSAGVAQIPGLKVVSPSGACIVPIGSDTLDIFQIGNRMEQRGSWKINTNRNPDCIAFWFGRRQGMRVAKALVEDLREAAAHVRTHPPSNLSGSISTYKASQDVPGSIILDVTKRYSEIDLTC